jgi:2-dehydro-3-deoxyphosphogluconate aldolase/(4S)-4-hydroxy-2-oxoglutarate aldolase
MYQIRPPPCRGGGPGAGWQIIRAMLTIEEAFPSAVAAVMRHDDPGAAYDACLAAVRGGIQTLEVTTSVPDHLGVVRRLWDAAGVPVGIGTVTEAAQVEAAAAAGASFVVTPVLVPEVAAAAQRAGLLCVLGALTPTEIFQAHRSGAGLVKVFPIAAVGGPRYVQLVTAPLGPIPLWVSGGVEIEEVPAYLKVGVRAVGLTTAVFPLDALRSGDFGTVTELARRASALTPA